MGLLETIGIIVEHIVHIGICLFFGYFAIVFLVQGIKDDIECLKEDEESE